VIQVARFAELSTGVLYGILKLRSDVFVVEQECAYPDIDGRDVEPDALHLWSEADGEIAAYLRVLNGPPDGVSRIGRVVTAPSARGQGLAAALMHRALAATVGPVVLDAQSYLVDWYRAFGFHVIGDEFLDDGIPHTPMRLER
jgi:ElaA protein